MKTDDHQELEIKLFLADLEAFQKRVEAQGAKLIEARLHEPIRVLVRPSMVCMRGARSNSP
jgi:hypothetical protein